MLFQDFALASLIDFQPYCKVFLRVTTVSSLLACLVSYYGCTTLNQLGHSKLGLIIYTVIISVSLLCTNLHASYDSKSNCKWWLIVASTPLGRKLEKCMHLLMLLLVNCDDLPETETRNTRLKSTTVLLYILKSVADIQIYSFIVFA